jgi:hypothetical protein
MDDDWPVSCPSLSDKELVDHLHDSLGFRAGPIPIPVVHHEVSDLPHTGGLQKMSP